MQEGLNHHGAWAAKIGPQAFGTNPPALSQVQILALPGTEKQFAEIRPGAMLTPPREDTIDPNGLGKLGSCHLVGLR